MDFKVLAVGDVVGRPGLDRVSRSLRYLKRKTGADFVIVNGENASAVGMTPQQGEDIFDAGADAITMGNHTFSKGKLCHILRKTVEFCGRLTMRHKFRETAGVSMRPGLAMWQ